MAQVLLYLIQKIFTFMQLLIFAEKWEIMSKCYAFRIASYFHFPILFFKLLANLV